MVWRAERTTPAEVEAALRAMLIERHGVYAGCVPARTLNLVCVVDGRSAEPTERLRELDRRHAARTLVCSVEPGRTAIGALAQIGSDMHPRPGELAVLQETVVLTVGERHVPHLESILDPLVVSDLPTVLWSPDDHEDALRALLPLAQVMLLDSIAEALPRAAIRRACGWLEHTRVVDLAWLRTSPWRERLATVFDPLPWRADLDEISNVEVRHHGGSVVVALLLVGWLAARLEWRLRRLRRRGRQIEGVAGAGGRDVRIRLAPWPRQRAHGLAGMTVEARSGRAVSLDRAPGGLLARQRDRAGAERERTLLGASRGEPGILGEGIRQALLVDGVYDRALAAARVLAPEDQGAARG
jgi:glucose-6-phosphate dehydrogenase assembly protein OpcA